MAQDELQPVGKFEPLLSLNEFLVLQSNELAWIDPKIETYFKFLRFNLGWVLFLKSFVHVSKGCAKEHEDYIPKLSEPLIILKCPDYPQKGPQEFRTFQYLVPLES